MRKVDVVVISMIGLICMGTPGCTAIGYVVGSSIDNGNATVDTLRVQKLRGLTAGVHIIALTKDSAVVTGVFLDIENTAPEVYHKQYDDWHANGESHLFNAELGDSIRLVLNSGANRHLAGEFAGLTETLIKVKRDAGPPYNVVVTPVNLKFVDSVAHDQSIYCSGPMLLSTIESGDIPIARQLVISEGADSVRIPMHMVLRIDRLDTNKPSLGRIIGAGFGFAIDVAATVGALTLGRFENSLMRY